MLRPKTKTKADRLGTVLLAGVAVVLVSTGVGAWWAMPQERDRVTGCLKHTTSAVHVVLVDTTDPYPSADTALLKRSLQALADGLAVEDRLVVLGFDGRDAAPLVAFEQCKPKSAAETSVWTENANKAERKFASTWLAPLSATIDKLTAITVSAKETHLAAFLGTTAAWAKGKGNNVVIHAFTDAGEHTLEGTLLSGRRRPMDDKAFAAYFATVTRGRLAGVTLDFRIFQTATAKGSEARIKSAWQRALSDAGVTYSWRLE